MFALAEQVSMETEWNANVLHNFDDCFSQNRSTINVIIADSQLRGNALVIGQGMSLLQRGLTADVTGKRLIVVPHQIAVGVDFDCQDEKLYWTDVSG